MRILAPAITLLASTAIVSTKATNLRGGNQEHRDLQWDNVCDVIPKEDWMAMAQLMPGLSAADADALYEACVAATQGNNETRTDVFTTNCHGQTAVMVWKALMLDKGGVGLGCESELDCPESGICFWDYNESSCNKVPGDGKKPMCGAPKPSNNTNIVP